mmetsp:Transcript_15321/g.22934  ORF Transcript_15321/g.22934 Transcript_15321/m.22934 type:complete len:440 (-) Transcript_15321:865-2184(-)
MGNQQSDVVGKVNLMDFDILKLIGKGGFGKVWKARKKDTGEIFALKVLNKKDVVEQDLVEHTRLERDIMGKFITHPFIVSLHYAFQTDDKLYFALDYMPGGSLWFHLRENKDAKPFSEDEVRFYASEVILAMAALHKHDVVYRDLKLENILLDADGHVSLTDFGLSAQMKPNKRIHSYSGSPAYLAPEILFDESGKGHDKSVDYWSLGVLIHLMLTRQAPFWGDDLPELFAHIKSAPLNLSQYENLLSADAISLLEGLLCRDPQKRLGCKPSIGVKELFQHAFFKSVDWDATIERKVSPPIKPQLEREINTQTDLGKAPSQLDSITSEQMKFAAKVASSKDAKKALNAKSKDANFKRFTFVSNAQDVQAAIAAANAGQSSAASSSSSSTSSPVQQIWSMQDFEPQSKEAKSNAVNAITDLHKNGKKSRRKAIRLVRKQR